MPYRTVNKMLMSYREHGQGKPVVLLHGFPLDWRIFEKQIAALSKQFRVIVPDLRGFGQSKNDEPFTMASLADDVHAMLQSMDALPCALGGLSMGGYVAFAFARKYASDLSSLTLIDTRAEADTPEGKAGREKMIQLARESGSKAIADQMMPKMLAEQTFQSNLQTVAQLRQIMESCPAKTIEHALAAMRDREDSVDLLSRITVPTLIIVGEHDAITPPAMAQSMNAKIAGSKQVQIADAGHLSTMEKPDEVSKAIESFLA